MREVKASLYVRCEVLLLLSLWFSDICEEEEEEVEVVMVCLAGAKIPEQLQQSIMWIAARGKFVDLQNLRLECL